MKEQRVYFLHSFCWKDKKTGKTVTVPLGYPSDGASGPAIDINSKAWGAHDVLCDRRTWDDGTQCTPRDASRVLSDILRAEGRNFRAAYWRVSTYIHTSIVWKFTDAPGLYLAYPDRAGQIKMIPGGVKLLPRVGKTDI